MTWYAIYKTDTGELYSTGTVIADQATLDANGLTAMPLDLDPTGMIWDAAAKTFSPAPPSAPINKDF